MSRILEWVTSRDPDQPAIIYDSAYFWNGADHISKFNRGLDKSIDNMSINR